MRRRTAHWALTVLVAAGLTFASGCSDDNANSQDAAHHRSDAGTGDAAPHTDADAASDGGADVTSDAGHADAAPNDAGPTDAQLGDGGLADTGDADMSDADAASTDAADTSPQPNVWHAPNCTEITGAGGVTFTTDEGATFTQPHLIIGGIRYTSGLVVLSNPGHMLAVTNQKLYRSTDAGCTWTKIGELLWEAPLYNITAGSEDRAYVWSFGGHYLYRIDGTTITQLTPPTYHTNDPNNPNQPIALQGLGTEPAKPGTVRLSSSDGTIYESTDSGQTWSTVGVPPNGTGALGYQMAFDPDDFNHAVFGMANAGAFVTFDGGQTWQQATGLGTGAHGRANLFRVVIAPSNSQVVWGLGLDLDENLNGNTSTQGRYIYRSTDGGATFTKELGRSSDVTLVNGQGMAPHPTDDNVLYFTFRGCAVGPGVTLYRYDHATGQTTWEKSHLYDRFSAFAFNPADPTVMYIGGDSERDPHYCPTP